MTETTRSDEVPPRRAEAYRELAHDLVQPIEPAARLRLTVTGDSMKPLLRAGDVVEVERVPPDDLCAGDIVVVQRQGEFVTHRLLGVDEHGWHTHGDRTRSPDAPVTAADIVGRVAALERGERRVDLQPARWRTSDRMIRAIDCWKLSVLNAARRWRPRTANQPVERWSAALAWPFQMSIRIIVAWSMRRAARGPRAEE
jgi:hypothetical protein